MTRKQMKPALVYFASNANDSYAQDREHGWVNNAFFGNKTPFSKYASRSRSG